MQRTKHTSKGSGEFVHTINDRWWLSCLVFYFCSQTGLSDAAYWLGGDMKRWRIPRPKMTTTAATTTTNSSSARGNGQQERRPADPPRDYLVNESSAQQETSGGSHLSSSNEGSPLGSSTNADDWNYPSNTIPPEEFFPPFFSYIWFLFLFFK